MHIETAPLPRPGRPRPSPAWLAQAPHRLMFFIGAANVLLAMLWWALWLVSARWGGWSMPELAIPAGWLHAFLMQYLVLPSFVFGFLLTVFPRWMGLPDLQRRHYLPVGANLMGGQLAILLGASGWAAGLTVGLWMALAGWTTALVLLGRLLADERGRTWHARSCFAALVLGWLGLAMFLAFVLGASPLWAFASIKLGGFGLLLPVYLTVAHRMFPFFAGNAVPGYRPWRPMAWLAAVWPLALAHLALELLHAYAWLWLADAPLLVLTGHAVWRWWPRGRMPGLLAVLFVGTAWLPVTFGLYLVQSVTYALDGGFILGRAPMHALFIGFFGSLLVAMVTRVTQGHSGRPLRMHGIAWFAFVAIQLVATLRILADVLPDPGMWQALAAIGWLLALSPWVARIGHIYLTPRRDGRPG
ncbi:NnrS family protein [Pseudoxanthomonas suwonensis 11-1]|uniref:NnrS family protein n=1 Tax=Pseudoxanthomonas suwonensis (strain 11-1) TaxID=743721 RepID=E6WPH6_PSEUU|nr:NnrS family protein [Pseudoxanthomonas suwonensis]ADV26220.1 NnrS family protein [Pseudoxanthomonas suwonensis 11-1]